MKRNAVLFLLVVGCSTQPPYRVSDPTTTSTHPIDSSTPPQPTDGEPAPLGCSQKPSAVEGNFDIYCVDTGAETADYAYRQDMYIGKDCDERARQREIDQICPSKFGLECKKGKCVFKSQP